MHRFEARQFHMCSCSGCAACLPVLINVIDARLWVTRVYVQHIRGQMDVDADELVPVFNHTLPRPVSEEVFHQLLPSAVIDLSPSNGRRGILSMLQGNPYLAVPRLSNAFRFACSFYFACDQLRRLCDFPSAS